MKRAFLLVVLGSILVASPATASDDDITTDTSVEPSFVGGELHGCSLIFDVAHRDGEYRKGELVWVAGSVNFYVFPNRLPEVAIKLGLHSGPGGDAIQAPAEVYLVRGTGTNKADRVSSALSNVSGFRLSTFRAKGQTLEDLMAIGETGHLQIGYAMEPSGLLSVVNINIRIKQLDFDAPTKSAFDPTAQKRWLGCIQDVTEAAIKRATTK